MLGIIGSLLLAVIGLASTGIWGALLMVSLLVLATAIYGLALRRTTWLRLPRKRSAAAIGAGIAFAVLIGSSSAYGAGHPTTPTAESQTASVSATAKSHAPAATRTEVPSPTPTPTPTHVPVVTTKDVNQTVAIPFTSTSVQDTARAKGTSAITRAGVNGVRTQTYAITFTDGTQTAKVLKSDVVTTAPVQQVTSVGAYVAPAPAPAPAVPVGCTSGTYVNSAGTTVCRPEAGPQAPAGATAMCNDGKYSFSQSRRGTCSGHGGVAEWL